LTEKQKDKVGKLQYLFVNGDNVAGVGVYPGQFDDLIIKDLYKQYEAFEEVMLQIPEYIQVFICTPAGTLLKTINGYVPVEKLKKGDEVYSFDEKQKKVVLNKITSLLKRKSEKLLKLKFSGGIELTCTPEHPLLVYENNGVVWKTAKELKEGIMLPIARAYEKKVRIKTLEILKNMNQEIYIKTPQKILSNFSINKSLAYLPSRTEYSYLSSETPMPISTLINNNNFNENLIEWPIKIKTHHGKFITLPEVFPPDFFYLIGIILTDGTFSKIHNKFPDGRLGDSYKIRIFNSNKEIISRVKNCLEQFNISPTEEFIEIPKKRIIDNREVFFKKQVINLSYTSKILGEILLYFGITPGPKKKSSMGKISTLNWENVKYFLAGLFDGDGTRNKKILRFSTSSDNFAKEMYLLLQEHGFAPNISFANKMFRVAIHRNPDTKKFLLEVPLMRISTRLPIFNDLISNGILENKSFKLKDEVDDFVLDRELVKIEEILGDVVYNIEVENTHTYVAMGFINHNCPGQHDAVRRAEPQPSISKEFLPRLHAQRNFHFISSPSWVETEGLKNLIYHGPSIHDLISNVSFLTMDHPEKGMVELLKKRDLMPGYGGRNPYVPEKKDYMVIKEEPDLVWIGDMHHNGYANYRGATVLNGGCWEAQTDFEKRIGHNPTPGIFPIINLKNRQISEFYFMRNNLQKDLEADQMENEEGVANA
jgi:intein/homing endonuclease